MGDQPEDILPEITRELELHKQLQSQLGDQLNAALQRKMTLIESSPDLNDPDKKLAMEEVEKKLELLSQQITSSQRCISSLTRALDEVTQFQDHKKIDVEQELASLTLQQMRSQQYPTEVAAMQYLDTLTETLSFLEARYQEGLQGALQELLALVGYAQKNHLARSGQRNGDAAAPQPDPPCALLYQFPNVQIRPDDVTRAENLAGRIKMHLGLLQQHSLATSPEGTAAPLSVGLTDFWRSQTQKFQAEAEESTAFLEACNKKCAKLLGETQSALVRDLTALRADATHLAGTLDTTYVARMSPPPPPPPPPAAAAAPSGPAAESANPESCSPPPRHYHAYYQRDRQTLSQYAGILEPGTRSPPPEGTAATGSPPPTRGEAPRTPPKVPGFTPPRVSPLSQLMQVVSISPRYATPTSPVITPGSANPTVHPGLTPPAKSPPAPPKEPHQAHQPTPAQPDGEAPLSARSSRSSLRSAPAGGPPPAIRMTKTQQLRAQRNQQQAASRNAALETEAAAKAGKLVPRAPMRTPAPVDLADFADLSLDDDEAEPAKPAAPQASLAAVGTALQQAALAAPSSSSMRRITPEMFAQATKPQPSAAPMPKPAPAAPPKSEPLDDDPFAGISFDDLPGAEETGPPKAGTQPNKGLADSLGDISF
ncbi:hypothetical protein PAPYR_5795 [Paratrimastix pyriformis]|uniref:Uncharacterized protein n=1 Tax=Paratrimastix pyriformis TaxID=342808 RepID=A0ABQ8UGN1_9EUKA|nr:hypothetical protein PAPYR_5795 [Paratrimastix pyriformis]